MDQLLSLARAIDAFNDRVGRLCRWVILAIVFISAGTAVARYAFSVGSNAWLEIQWYLYSAVFLGAAGYTLRHNAHVRIDVVFGRLSRRTQAWIDVVGALVMLLPVCALMIWFGWDAAMESLRVREMSPDAGGLARWPIKLLVPAAFVLLVLQAFSETVKRIAFLLGMTEEPPGAGEPTTEPR